MNKEDISVQLYTTRKFKPYTPILDFLSLSGIVNIELFGLESLNIEEFREIMDKKKYYIKIYSRWFWSIERDSKHYW